MMFYHQGREVKYSFLNENCVTFIKINERFYIFQKLVMNTTAFPS